MQSIAQLFDQAMRLHRVGNLQQAELLYRQVLQIDPRHANSLHLLGMLAYQSGRSDLAIETIREALRSQPEFPGAHNNLGNILRLQGRLDEAIAHHRQAVELKPDYAEAYSNLGNALCDQGNLDEAVASYHQALRLRPDFAEVYSNLGNALYEQGHFDEAITHCLECLRRKPDFAEAYNNLAAALQSQGRIDEAIANYRHALQLLPNYTEAIINLGTAFQDQGKFDEAIAQFRQAQQLTPNYAKIFNNLGTVSHQQGKFDEAVAYYQQAVGLLPNYADAFNNLAIVFQDQGQFDKAVANYHQALRHDGKHANSHYHLAMLLLRLGDFAKGWTEYEWRWRATDFLRKRYSRPPSSQKFWDGSPVRDRIILLRAEQGLGDTIQFVRYAALVKQHGAAQVWLVCQPELQRLISQCRGVDRVLLEPPSQCYDVESFLLSLPRLLGTLAVDRIPATGPYIDCDPACVQRWEARLAEGETIRPSLRVGIVWQGNPNHGRDKWRSVALQQFASLVDLPRVRLVSLQKGVGREQLAQQPGLALDLGPELTDLADTAAVICCLDLVISVDTAVAHLAGALGAPVWVALPFVADWRWLLEREHSPWYPSMRLFRQKAIGDWDEVFHRIKDALADLPGGAAGLTFRE